MHISKEKVSDYFLELNSCERQILSDKNYTMHRKNGRTDYHILYITEGCCHAKIDGRMKKVSAGNIILYKPFEEQLYKFYAKDKPVSCYIHFSGSDCENLLSDLGINRSIFYAGSSHTLSNLFIEMRDEFIVDKPFKKEVCSALLMRFLAHAARCVKYKTEGVDVKNTKRMQEICSHMHMNYRYNYSVEYYADKCNLSVDRFSHAFKENVGVSPKQYMQEIKLAVACDLLKNTDLDICEVANAVGVSDSSYFTKLIKRHTGHTPSYFRT